MSTLTILTKPVESVPETISGISYEEFLNLGEDYNFAEWVDVVGAKCISPLQTAVCWDGMGSSGQ